MTFVALLAVIAAPHPSPSPLRTITHVHASPFCSTLRESVGPAVKALLENDLEVAKGKKYLLKMAQDQVSSVDTNAVLDMDVHYLGPEIDAMAKNLQTLQSELSQAERRRPAPGTQEAQELDAMERQLQAIAARQNQALNVLSGIYFSWNGNRLLGKSNPLAGAIALQPVSDPPDSEPDTPLVLPPMRPQSAASASPAPRTSVSPAPRATVRSVYMGLAGGTGFARLFNELTTVQLLEEPLESNAAKTILSADAQCKP